MPLVPRAVIPQRLDRRSLWEGEWVTGRPPFALVPRLLRGDCSYVMAINELRHNTSCYAVFDNTADTRQYDPRDKPV